jgi:hypothetical protein
MIDHKDEKIKTLQIAHDLMILYAAIISIMLF